MCNPSHHRDAKSNDIGADFSAAQDQNSLAAVVIAVAMQLLLNASAD